MDNLLPEPSHSLPNGNEKGLRVLARVAKMIRNNPNITLEVLAQKLEAEERHEGSGIVLPKVSTLTLNLLFAMLG